MATKQDEGQRRRWQGDEVEDRPGGDAERAADRAEGNRAVRADVEVRRRREDDAKTPVPTGAPERDEGRAAAPAEDASDEIADAADEHRARRDAGERPPRGKL